MKCVSYRSTAAEGLRDQDVQALVTASQERNVQYNITGLLLFDGTNFLQYFEGDDMDVDYLMSLILSDTRHRNIEVLSENYIAGREFPDWSMQLIPYRDHEDIPAGLLNRLPPAVQSMLRPVKIN